MNRSELITAAIRAENLVTTAGTPRDAIAANQMAYACRIASLVLAEQIQRIPEVG